MNTQIAKVAAAEVLGCIAFKAGKSSVPAHDPELMKLLVGNRVGEGIPVLNAWARGWHNANLAAPVAA